MIIILNNTLIDGRVGSFQELEANKVDKTELAAYTKTPDLGNLYVWSLTDAEGNIEYLVNANASAYTEGEFDAVEAHIDMVEMRFVRLL